VKKAFPLLSPSAYEMRSPLLFLKSGEWFSHLLFPFPSLTSPQRQKHPFPPFFPPLFTPSKIIVHSPLLLLPLSPGHFPSSLSLIRKRQFLSFPPSPRTVRRPHFQAAFFLSPCPDAAWDESHLPLHFSLRGRYIYPSLLPPPSVGNNCAPFFFGWSV